MRKIDFIQPRHNYAQPEAVEKHGHIYLPTSLHTAGARLITAGVDVSFYDENFGRSDIRSSVVGVNLLGAPYVPEVITLQKRLQTEIGDDVRLLLGGQVMNGITPDERAILFGASVINGNDDEALSQAVGISPLHFQNPKKLL